MHPNDGLREDTPQSVFQSLIRSSPNYPILKVIKVDCLSPNTSVLEPGQWNYLPTA